MSSRLDSPGDIIAGLRGIHTLLNCAGPFGKTAQPMSDACLRTKAHYLDITGEIAVFEHLASRDADARSAGVVLLPGVGFDVVPSDCLAVHLKSRLPSANRLVLAFRSSGRLSRGTALTTLERISDGGTIREEGRLKPVPTAWKTRVFDFGDGPVRAMTIPWGDVATAFYSTGIPNIEVYVAVPWTMRMGARLTRRLGWLLRSRWVQNRLRARINSGSPGPTEAERRQNRCSFWAEVTDARGQRAVARQDTPDGYDLTVQSAVGAAARVLGDGVPPGFHTPAMAFGPNFVLELPGVVRTDVVLK